MARYAKDPEHVQKARNEILAMNEVIDAQRTLLQERTFPSFASFLGWVTRLEDVL